MKQITNEWLKMENEFNQIILKLNHILFKWYYKRVPKYFHKFTIINSINRLIYNYIHTKKVEDVLYEIIFQSSTIEKEMKSEILKLELEISSLKLRQIFLDQYKIDTINDIISTNKKANGQ